MARFVTGEIFMEGLDRLLKERIKNLNQQPQVTEDAEFEVIKSELHDPEGSTVKVFFEEAAAIQQDVFDKTLAKAKSFPVYVGIDFSKGPDNSSIAENTEA